MWELLLLAEVPMCTDRPPVLPRREGLPRRICLPNEERAKSHPPYFLLIFPLENLIRKMKSMHFYCIFMSASSDVSKAEFEEAREVLDAAYRFGMETHELISHKRFNFHVRAYSRKQYEDEIDQLTQALALSDATRRRAYSVCTRYLAQQKAKRDAEKMRRFETDSVPCSMSFTNREILVCVEENLLASPVGTLENVT